MLKFSAVCFLLCLPFLTEAQKTSSSVKGVVYDTAAKRGLAYATVSIVNAKDSTLVSFARADSTGKFSLQNIAKGKYLFSSSYVGFVPVWREIEVHEAQELSLGNINMTDVASSGDVTVTARRPPVTINNDTVEFNTENFKTQPNAVVEDLLKKLPGVTVDNDGTVRVNGQKINRVLVNGKEFFTGDPKLATKNLDADAIDKVQVFDKKSDRAEFTGVDDGQSEKAINLKLKKDRNHALFGKVTAGAGTDSKYDAQTNINKFNGDQQLSALGMANNTNRQGFSIGDVLNFTGELSKGMRSGGGITVRGGGGDDGGLPVTGLGGNQQGVATTYAGGLNYNDNWNKKTDVNLSGMGSKVDLHTDRNSVRHTIIPGSEFDYFNNSSAVKSNRQQRINMAIDSKIDSFTSIKFTPVITTQQTDTRAITGYTTQNPDGSKINTGSTDNNTRSNALNFNGNALFRKRFKKKGRTLSSTLSLAYNDSKQDGSTFNKSTYYSGGVPLPDSIVDQRSHREAISRSLGGNIVYTEPIGKRSLLELSGYYNSSTGNSMRNTYDYGTSGKYDQLNMAQSNDFKNEYNYGGGSLNFRSNQKQFNFTIGGSVQQSVLLSTNNTTKTVVKQDFTDVLPNANLQYKFSSSQTLTMNYATSTQQPSALQLQPVLDISDPQNTYIGNPNLKRSYMQSLSVNFFSANMYTQRNFFAFLSASKTANAIVNTDIIDPVTKVRRTTPVNTNGNYNIFASTNAGFPIKKLKSRIDIGLGATVMHNNSFINGQQNGIDNMSLSPNLNYSFSIDNLVDLMLTSRINISRAKYSLQPALNSNYLQQVYGADLTNYLPWGMILNNNFNYTINSGRADGYNTAVPFWNASLAKGFLKNKRAELKLSVFDLLNQNQGISRSSNQNYIEDTRYNVLQRYFLLSFSFRLNKAASSGGPKIVTRTIGG